MRLNVDNYRCILGKSGLNDGEVCKRTGISPKTLLWILENRFIEVSTLEHIADAIGCTPGEIMAPEIGTGDYTGFSENVIEWVKNQEKATLTLSQRRTISRVKKLAEKYPEECQIVAENKDGSVYAHIPVSWIKISPPKKVSEEQVEKARERMKAFNLSHVTTRDNLD